jgi:hypothetical protein
MSLNRSTMSGGATNAAERAAQDIVDTAAGTKPSE